MKKSFDMLKDETAYDVLDRVCTSLGTSTKVDSSVVVREFEQSKSMDFSGREAPSNHVTLDRTWLRTLLSPKKRNEASVKGVRHELLYSIERRIGAPYLKRIKKKKLRSVVKPVDRKDVEARLEKYRRRAQRELKSLRQLHPGITEVQSDYTPAAINTLHFILMQYVDNGINAIGMNNILDFLFTRIVRRERDKLFYIRRHPTKGKLHKCFDESIIAEIDQAVWALGCNPFQVIYNKQSLSDLDNGVVNGQGYARF